MEQLLIYSAMEETLIGKVLKGDGAGSVCSELLEFASSFNLKGNVWQHYITWQLMMDENPFSLTCEKADPGECTMKELALVDMEQIYQWFMGKEQTSWMKLIQNYVPANHVKVGSNKHIGALVTGLSEQLAKTTDAHAFLQCLMEFYSKYGVGEYGLNKSFRLMDGEGVVLQPIRNMDPVVLDDLIGYENQKKKLIDNTEAFVRGIPANNVLLFGDSGTGKSTSIKAIVNQYYEQGLRMIEVYKHQMRDLSNVIAQVKERNYRFIIYMDDLSFEDFEVEYKYLKAVIEGGVETRPENVLIYATSNRRHLIRERWSDRNDVDQQDGMHHSDTMEEKLSLANRFGVTISYSKPGPKEFFHIVEELAKKAELDITQEELRREANKWELSHGGISGRTAQQFINYIVGIKRMQELA